MRNFLLLIVLALPLVACETVGGLFDGPEETRLAGERISVLELQKSLKTANPNAAPGALPEEWDNSFWPQAGGYANHAMGHLGLAVGKLATGWKTSIGEGGSDEIPHISTPVVANDRIFTLDTEFQVSAFGAKDGRLIWRTDVGNPEEGDTVISGGIAFSGRSLYVTNGYNEVLSLSPADGKISWRQNIGAPSRAAPTILEGRVFISTLDNRLLALDATNGEELWEYVGITESAGLIGAASPAANKDIVVPVFSSGEVSALRIENGSVAWSDNLANVRGMGGLTSISDIRAMPVIDEGMVFAISFAGRLVAIDERTGTRVWEHEISGSQTPWVTADAVYVLSSDHELFALTKDKGEIIWMTELEKYDEDDDPIHWHGPALAGGRLLVSGSNGDIAHISAQDGIVMGRQNLGDPLTSAPVIAGRTLYIVSQSGILHAMRGQKIRDKNN